MRNILSLNGQKISGKEIKDWITYHSTNSTSHTKVAKHMVKYLNIEDYAYYCIELSPSGTSCGTRKRYYPDVIKVDRNYTKYQRRI